MSNLGSRTCTSSKAACSLSGNKVDINHHSDWHRRGMRLETEMIWNFNFVYCRTFFMITNFLKGFSSDSTFKDSIQSHLWIEHLFRIHFNWFSVLWSLWWAKSLIDSSCSGRSEERHPESPRCATWTSSRCIELRTKYQLVEVSQIVLRNLINAFRDRCSCLDDISSKKYRSIVKKWKETFISVEVNKFVKKIRYHE